MFSLFSGKISSVFSLAFQGLTKAVGAIIETINTTVESVIDLVTEVTTPITDILTTLPVIGAPLDSVLTTTTNLVNNVTDTLGFAAEQLSTGDFLSATTNIAAHVLDTTTDTLGQTLTDASLLIQDVANLTSPITGSVLGDIPFVGDLLTAVGETANNLSGFVTETGDYVADIVPGALIAGLFFDPAGSVGGVLQDVSGTLDNLLNDLVPVTDVLSDVPVAGSLVDIVGQTAGAITDGLYNVGSLISQINPLDTFQLNNSLI